MSKHNSMTMDTYRTIKDILGNGVFYKVHAMATQCEPAANSAQGNKSVVQ
jgi:hypothetical protein